MSISISLHKGRSLSEYLGSCEHNWQPLKDTQSRSNIWEKAGLNVDNQSLLDHISCCFMQDE